MAESTQRKLERWRGKMIENGKKKKLKSVVIHLLFEASSPLWLVKIRKHMFIGCCVKCHILPTSWPTSIRPKWRNQNIFSAGFHSALHYFSSPMSLNAPLSLIRTSAPRRVYFARKRSRLLMWVAWYELDLHLNKGVMTRCSRDDGLLVMFTMHTQRYEDTLRWRQQKRKMKADAPLFMPPHFLADVLQDHQHIRT